MSERTKPVIKPNKGDNTVSTPSSPSGSPKKPGQAKPEQGNAKGNEQKNREGRDKVDEASWESFPASDAPSY